MSSICSHCLPLYSKSKAYLLLISQWFLSTALNPGGNLVLPQLFLYPLSSDIFFSPGLLLCHSWAPLAQCAWQRLVGPRPHFSFINDFQGHGFGWSPLNSRLTWPTIWRIHPCGSPYTPYTPYRVPPYTLSITYTINHQVLDSTSKVFTLLLPLQPFYRPSSSVTCYYPTGPS